MKNNSGRYSGYIRPFTYLFDLSIILVFVTLILPNDYHFIYFYLFAGTGWTILALNIGFYEVYRFTKGLSIVEKTVKQFAVFAILCYSFSGFYFNNVQSFRIANYILFCFLPISFFKLFIFYFLKKYRVFFGGNYRKVVVIGSQIKTNELIRFFEDNPDYGYRLVKDFKLDADKKLSLDEAFNFIKNEKEDDKIDEIYCAIADLTEKQISDFIDFADNNLKILKFIPNDKDYFVQNMKLDYYGYIPILSLRAIPLDDRLNQLIKRTFDLIFSSLIIVFVLSWLIPIMGILIKLESKGPIFFKQKRNGLNYKEFSCYKFRSMKINATADLKQVSKNDPRITRMGTFIRKTSMDELPQFFNVFLGEMSVVGPRPHMISETERFALKVDKFMVRHFVKPGITGMAQTNGFRGEVENDKDIIFRVKYDIFYMENWSILLDLKIIVLTVVNAIRGDKKAY
jgi:putative colanic acid biosynthesis UDP-glucose lipid carrier transferase